MHTVQIIQRLSPAGRACVRVPHTANHLPPNLTSVQSSQRRLMEFHTEMKSQVPPKLNKGLHSGTLQFIIAKS